MTRCHTIKPGCFWGICTFSKVRSAGKVAAVKKLVCHLLIVWLAFVSGGASAHAINDVAHMAAHATGHEAATVQHASGQATQTQTAQDDTRNLAAVAVPDTRHADACGQTHCGHGHTTGILETLSTFPSGDATTSAPATHRSDTSNSIATMIERPNWRFTTPAVVSLLN